MRPIPEAGEVRLQYYFDYPDEVAVLVFIGSYSAGKQLTVTEDQVLQPYETLQDRQTLFQLSYPKRGRGY